MQIKEAESSQQDFIIVFDDILPLVQKGFIIVKTTMS